MAKKKTKKARKPPQVIERYDDAWMGRHKETCTDSECVICQMRSIVIGQITALEPEMADTAIDLAIDMLLVLGHAMHENHAIKCLHAAITKKVQQQGFNEARARFDPAHCKADDIDQSAILDACFELASEYMNEVSKDDPDSDWTCQRCKEQAKLEDLN